MFSLSTKRNQKGFTIVELLIVIVVIGILAALVVTTYAGIQAKARDSKRQTDIQALQTQVEAFYATNNYYPSAGNINSQAFRTASMKSLDPDTLKDPSGTVQTLATSAATATSRQYGYVAVQADGTTACTGTGTTTDTACSSYTLSTWLEGTNAIYTKKALD